MNSNELQSRLNLVKNSIKEAVERSGRTVKDVKLIAVSKQQVLDKISFFKERGIVFFGENRVQELIEKNKEITDINWHFIGHLQRNKVKYLLRIGSCKLIHSLDSWRLAKEIDKQARKNNRKIAVLIQVNISGEESKFGLEPDLVAGFLDKLQQLENVEVKGLMTMAPYIETPEDARPYFSRLAQLKHKLQLKGYSLPELSMGMTNDFEVAIEEGSTMVRIGTALFGKREDRP